MPPPLIFIFLALGISLIVCLTLAIGMSLGDERYERIQDRIDDEVIAFAASIPDYIPTDSP